MIRQDNENSIHNPLGQQCCLFRYPGSGGLGTPCLFIPILDKNVGVEQAHAVHRHPPAFFTETLHHPAAPEMGNPSLSARPPYPPPFVCLGKESRAFLFPLLPNPAIQAQLVKSEKLKSEPRNLQRSERSQ